MIYILIPVYNEEPNIDKLFKNLSNEAFLEDAQYIFVDDCSTDKTVEKIKESFKEKKIKVITKNKNNRTGAFF